MISSFSNQICNDCEKNGQALTGIHTILGLATQILRFEFAANWWRFESLRTAYPDSRLRRLCRASTRKICPKRGPRKTMKKAQTLFHGSLSLRNCPNVNRLVACCRRQEADGNGQKSDHKGDRIIKSRKMTTWLSEGAEKGKHQKDICGSLFFSPQVCDYDFVSISISFFLLISLFCLGFRQFAV